MLLNTAEGNSKPHGRHRAKFFDDARGSAFECAACLDASVAKRFVLPDQKGLIALPIVFVLVLVIDL